MQFLATYLAIYSIPDVVKILVEPIRLGAKEEMIRRDIWKKGKVE